MLAGTYVRPCQVRSGIPRRSRRARRDPRPRRRAPEQRLEELGAQPLGPASVGQQLLRGLGGEARKEAFLGRHIAQPIRPSSRTARCARLRPGLHPSRKSEAACSGATMFRFSPVESSRPARWVRRGAMSMRQQNCSTPRGAVRTHRFRGGLEPSRRASRVSPSCSSEAPVGPSVSKRALRAARGEHQLEGQARGVGREQHRLVVDRHDALAAADLLGDHVLEQRVAHRARRVRAGALALAGDLGGDEVERVQLRVRVRQRGAALAPLVDDQLHVGRSPCRGRACARATPPPPRGPARAAARPARAPTGVR